LYLIFHLNSQTTTRTACGRPGLTTRDATREVSGVYYHPTTAAGSHPMVAAGRHQAKTQSNRPLVQVDKQARMFLYGTWTSGAVKSRFVEDKVHRNRSWTPSDTLPRRGNLIMRALIRHNSAAPSIAGRSGPLSARSSFSISLVRAYLPFKDSIVGRKQNVRPHHANLRHVLGMYPKYNRVRSTGPSAWLQNGWNLDGLSSRRCCNLPLLQPRDRRPMFRMVHVDSAPAHQSLHNGILALTRCFMQDAGITSCGY